jgi:acyl phosphate:glycerol-3-phosphate acyltransferase
MRFVPYFVFAYFLGAIPFAYLAGKLKGVDIRRHGSGNVGATNAVRVLGKAVGYPVFALDVLKGVLPVLIFKHSALGSLSDSTMILAVGLAALLGHVFTPFLGFKGGKGVATGAGVLLGGFPVLFSIVIAVWLIVFFATRIVSVSSLGAAAALVVASVSLGYKTETILVFALVAGFIFWTHRSNIARLMRGEEGRKVSSNK